MQRPLHVAVSSSATTIDTIDAETMELIAYDIYTTDGAKVDGGPCHGNVHQLPIGTIPPGIYLLKATDANGQTHTYKIVK
jgi:hypothetical protein